MLNDPSAKWHPETDLLPPPLTLRAAALFVKCPSVLPCAAQGHTRLPTLAETGFTFDVGRYNERRRSMYTSDLFGESEDLDVAAYIDEHIGIGGATSTGTEMDL